MNIKPIPDGNSNFEDVYLHSSSIYMMETPHCKKHGAMNKVSSFKTPYVGGYWRCIATSEIVECRSGCIQYEENQ